MPEQFVSLLFLDLFVRTNRLLTFPWSLYQNKSSLYFSLMSLSEQIVSLLFLGLCVRTNRLFTFPWSLCQNNSSLYFRLISLSEEIVSLLFFSLSVGTKRPFAFPQSVGHSTSPHYLSCRSPCLKSCSNHFCSRKSLWGNMSLILFSTPLSEPILSVSSEQFATALILLFVATLRFSLSLSLSLSLYLSIFLSILYLPSLSVGAVPHFRTACPLHCMTIYDSPHKTLDSFTPNMKWHTHTRTRTSSAVGILEFKLGFCLFRQF